MLNFFTLNFFDNEMKRQIVFKINFKKNILIYLLNASFKNSSSPTEPW